MRTLMRITPDVVAMSREFLEFEANGYVPDLHVGNLFPIHPERVVKIWDAYFEIRPGQTPPRALLVLKDGSVIREVNHVKCG